MSIYLAEEIVQGDAAESIEQAIQNALKANLHLESATEEVKIILEGVSHDGNGYHVRVHLVYIFADAKPEQEDETLNYDPTRGQADQNEDQLQRHALYGFYNAMTDTASTMDPDIARQMDVLNEHLKNQLDFTSQNVPVTLTTTRDFVKDMENFSPVFNQNGYSFNIMGYWEPPELHFDK